MTSNQFTAPRTVVASSGMILPATITPETDMNMLVTAICLYHSFNERRTDYDTLEAVMEAMRDGSAIVVLYTDVKGDRAARVLWPSSITLSADNNFSSNRNPRRRLLTTSEWRSLQCSRPSTRSRSQLDSRCGPQHRRGNSRRDGKRIR